MTNRLPETYAPNYPTRHNKREKKLIDTAVARMKRDTEETFQCQPLCGADNGAGAATGSTGDVNVMRTDQNLFEYHIKGAGQTLVAPSFSSTGLGLDISLDQTDDEGVEFTQGITSRSKSAFTVGTDPAFYFECQFSIADVSGTDDCAMGFRKAEAYQAAIDNYDEMAAINVISGDIKLETILNNAATVTTDTTQNWADGETHTLRVEVAFDGKVTYKIDDAPPTTTAAFAFDAGEVVVPFFYFLHAADVAGAVNLKSWKVGYVNAA